MEAQRRIADEALSQAPQPIEIIVTGGRLQGDVDKARSATSLKDMDKIEALAVAFKVYGNPAYATAAGTYLAAWAGLNRPSGQAIDETGLEPGIFGYRIVRMELPAILRSRIDQWMRNIARAEIGSRDISKGTAKNNWHSHRLKTVGLIGFAVGDSQLIAYARDGFKAQIQDNLLPDGSSIDFLERDALSYHVYDLRPLTALAMACSETGEDLYHWQAANGASVARSVQWLLPFVRGEKVHAEFVGSHVPFDIKRSRNHEKGHEIGALWEPKNALPLLDMAVAYDASLGPLARSFGTTPHLRLVLSSLGH